MIDSGWQDWAVLIAAAGWAFRIERQATKLVSQNERSIELHVASEKLHQKAEGDIKELDLRVDNHETRISIIESKPAQGFSAQ